MSYISTNGSSNVIEVPTTVCKDKANKVLGMSREHHHKKLTISTDDDQQDSRTKADKTSLCCSLVDMACNQTLLISICTIC